MKYKTPLLIVALNLALLLTLVIMEPQSMIAPGDPMQAHEEIASDCFACHTPFIGSRPEKCMACHKVEDIGLKTTEGVTISREKKNVAFHQKLVEEDCVACHSDHKGVMPFRPISQFSHELVELSTREQCDGCHSNPGDNLHLKIEGGCNQCHGMAAWTPATFNHDDYFRFDRHHDADCETCHLDNNYSAYTCYGCHEHSRSKIRGEHYEEGIRDYENCTECHRSGDEHEAERRWRSLSRESGAYRYWGSGEHDDDDDEREHGRGHDDD